jgi:hypothetical protein
VAWGAFINFLIVAGVLFAPVNTTQKIRLLRHRDRRFCSRKSATSPRPLGEARLSYRFVVAARCCTSAARRAIVHLTS